MKKIGSWVILLILIIFAARDLNAVGTSSQAPEIITLATFNVRMPCDEAPNDWSSRALRIKAVLDKYKIDIFGVQEPVKQQISDIVAMGNFASVGVGREDGIDSGEFSSIIYNKDRFEVIDSGTFWLSETPEQPGSRSWDSACPRVVTWGIFVDKNTGKKFTYYNTHFDHISESARLHSAQMLLERIQHQPDSMPIIVSGDLNATIDSEPIKLLGDNLKNTENIAEKIKVPLPITYNAFIKDQSQIWDNQSKIDYIFVRGPINVLSYTLGCDLVNNELPSDHYPIIVDLQL